MNKLFIPIIALVFAACGESGEEPISTELVGNPNSASAEMDPEQMPVLVFDEESYDFGEIAQGEKVTYDFAFKNTGKSDLIISSALGSCGCTVPSYPKEPIKPGGKGVIHVVFDSNGKKGAQHKKVTVVANTNPNKTMVALMGTVLAPEVEESSEE